MSIVTMPVVDNGNVSAKKTLQAVTDCLNQRDNVDGDNNTVVGLGISAVI